MTVKRIVMFRIRMRRAKRSIVRYINKGFDSPIIYSGPCGEPLYFVNYEQMRKDVCGNGKDC